MMKNSTPFLFLLPLLAAAACGTDKWNPGRDACCDGAEGRDGLDSAGDAAPADGASDAPGADGAPDAAPPDGDGPAGDDAGGAPDGDGDAPGDAAETDYVLPCTPVTDTGCAGTEQCDDGLDNNCDGRVDEGCYCTPGETEACFRGMPAHRGLGGCSDGTHVCPMGEFPTWYECEGGIVESLEVCDGRDNDCNGCVDDIPDCLPSILCPGDTYASPLHWFDLKGDPIYGGAPVAWQWTVTPPPGSATTGPECAGCKNTRVWLDLSGDWLVHVEFVDALGTRWTCDFVVHVRGEGIRVEMWWNEGVPGDLTDVDLHLHRDRPSTGWFNGDDCYYTNCDNYPSRMICGFYTIDWGYALTPAALCPSPAPFCSDYSGGCPNPRLDLDDVNGNGPENINIDYPNDGDRFRVAVHYYDDEGATEAAAPTFVRIHCGGMVKAMYGPASLDSQGTGVGDIWRVADVEWDGPTSDCTVTPIAPGGTFDIRPDSSRSSF